MSNVKLSNIDVTYVDHMGTDKTIVNSARVSFDSASSSEFTKKDEKLLSYLATNDHWSPFAHTSIQLKLKAPIFIARQLVKHQVGGVWNEVSRRYVSSTPEFYLPNNWRDKPINAKQGSGTDFLNKEINDEVALTIYEYALTAYTNMVDDGVCPELARMVLPLGCMTDWYWTGSLMFWARVVKQRSSDHAQKEARDIAEKISLICSELFPIAWKELMI